MRRRPVIADYDGTATSLPPLDITSAGHASSQHPLIAIVEEQCDLGHWHLAGKIRLPRWGPALTERSS